MEYEDKKTTHSGITYYRLRRYDTTCFVHVIDLKLVKIKLTYPFDSVTNAVNKYKSQLGFNGGGWSNTPPYEPNEYLIIDGNVISAVAKDNRPCVSIDNNGNILFLENQPNFNTSINVFGFDRIIARNGTYNSKITNTNSEPRTVYGKDLNNNLVVLVCEGRLWNQKGLTFKEIWSVMREFGVTDCGNADGGYSSAAVNTSFDPPLLNKTYLVENRKVVHQVLFYAYANESNDGIGDRMNYIINEPVRPRSKPSMNTNDTFENLPIGYKFSSNTIITVTEVINGVNVTIKFHELPDGRFVPEYLPYTNKTYVVLDQTPPPTGDPTSVDINLKLSGANLGLVIINDVEYIKK